MVAQPLRKADQIVGIIAKCCRAREQSNIGKCGEPLECPSSPVAGVLAIDRCLARSDDRSPHARPIVAKDHAPPPAAGGPSGREPGRPRPDDTPPALPRTLRPPNRIRLPPRDPAPRP